MQIQWRGHDGPFVDLCNNATHDRTTQSGQAVMVVSRRNDDLLVRA